MTKKHLFYDLRFCINYYNNYACQTIDSNILGRG